MRHASKLANLYNPFRAPPVDVSMIFQLFIDESGYGQTAPEEAFIMAGFIGGITQWQHFTRGWSALLNEAPILSAEAFKTLLRRKRNSRRIEKFVGVLNKSGVHRTSVYIPRKSYEKIVLAELPKWKRWGLDEAVIWLIRNEYYFGFFGLLMWILIPMLRHTEDTATLEVIYDRNIHEAKNSALAIRI